MSKYILDFWLDGYEDEAEREKAELEFIEEQLNFTASSVKVRPIQPHERVFSEEDMRVVWQKMLEERYPNGMIAVSDFINELFSERKDV